MNIIKLLLIVFFCPVITFSQAARIHMDGVFNDWDGIEPIYTDATGDQEQGNTDLGRMWVTNDQDYLYIRFEVGEEVNLQSDNELGILIDADNNTTTGFQAYGIGAEIIWHFGDRLGMYYPGAAGEEFSHNNLGIITAPTVTSTDFEIAISREARPDGGNLLFTGSDISIVLKDYGQGEDRLPDNDGGVLYSFDETSLPPVDEISIAKESPNAVRFLTYNVYTDNLFEGSLIPSYTRILRAIEPEIIGLQEVYNHTGLQTKDQIEMMLPSGEGQEWHYSKVQPDIVAVSRFPIINTYQIEGTGGYNGNGAFLIDMNDSYCTNLLFIVAHPPAGGNNWERQYEIDAIMAFIRDAKEPGGELTLEPETPILIVGDMNLVGYAQQLETFLTGEIINTGDFGESFDPDWDGSTFADLLPRHVATNMYYTWYSEYSSFHPGRLDFMIYSDSVLEPVKSFVLFTPTISQDSLNTYNIVSTDATQASDHLPVVADFVFTGNSSLRGYNNIKKKDPICTVYPNPFNPKTIIEFSLPYSGNIDLSIYNIAGRKVTSLLSGYIQEGNYNLTWDAKGLSSGVYFFRLIGEEIVQTGRMVLVK